TTITRRTIDDLDEICDLVSGLDISLWSIFFLVPIGRGKPEDEVTAEDFERVFAKMYAWSKYVHFDIKSTAAPHYRRYVMQRRLEESRAASSAGKCPPGVVREQMLADSDGDGISRAPKAVNDGNGLVFVSHTGDIYPSGFLPMSAGNVRYRSLVTTYREDPLFQQLRDYDHLLGKCGHCEYRNVCGGSRARTFALTQKLMEAEPFCSYIPPSYSKLVAAGQELAPEEYFRTRMGASAGH
ncbi:MAG: radical SAM/SPASM domain-containing protein, partial [Candidatus Wallbacteria bacterium]|nr:radical SAM/SPASM domain-containing protein [Candidatus Wallbacteria bacterium]